MGAKRPFWVFGPVSFGERWQEAGLTYGLRGRLSSAFHQRLVATSNGYQSPTHDMGRNPGSELRAGLIYIVRWAAYGVVVDRKTSRPRSLVRRWSLAGILVFHNLRQRGWCSYCIGGGCRSAATCKQSAPCERGRYMLLALHKCRVVQRSGCTSGAVKSFRSAYLLVLRLALPWFDVLQPARTSYATSRPTGFGGETVRWCCGGVGGVPLRRYG